MHIFGVWLSFSPFLSEVTSISCGIDRSPEPLIREGISRLEYYPWLGVLYYPTNDYKLTTGVVLVTRQMVLAAATEIDNLPKDNFRALARVTIGYNCSGPPIAIRDYAYHPDYSKGSYNTLAIIQLETDHVRIELRPICPPPMHINSQNFFAMVLSDSCKQSQVRIYEMKYVPPAQCYRFYKRTGLAVHTLWPSYTACARSIRGDECVWRSGTILVVKVGKRWRLLGIGVYGPGCQAPARFLDYGMHHDWVRRSTEKIGRPAITTLEDNHIILRKISGNIQRFGPCDTEEMDDVFYTESTIIEAFDRVVTMSHNLTLYTDVEYSCIIIRADNNKELGVRDRYAKPLLHIRRWCARDSELCYGFNLLDIDIVIDIKFNHSVNLEITAFGKQARYIDPEKSFAYLNSYVGRPTITSYEETKRDYQNWLGSPSYGSGPFQDVWMYG